MKVNLNTVPCTANFAANPTAKPPPLPRTIKTAAMKATEAIANAVSAAVTEAPSGETTTRKFSIEDWEDFFMQYWHRSDGILEHWFRDIKPNTSLGLRTAGDVIQLNQNGRKY